MASLVRNNLPDGAAALGPLLADPEHPGAVYIETVSGNMYRVTGGGRVDDFVRSFGAGTLVGFDLDVLAIDCEVIRPDDVLAFLPERPSPVTRVVVTDDRRGTNEPDAAYFERLVQRLTARERPSEPVLVPQLDATGAQVGWQVARRYETHRPRNSFRRLLAGSTEATIVTAGDDGGLLGASMLRARVQPGAQRPSVEYDTVDPNSPPLIDRPFEDVFGVEPLTVVEVPNAQRIAPLPLHRALDLPTDTGVGRVRTHVARHLRTSGVGRQR